MIYLVDSTSIRATCGTVPLPCMVSKEFARFSLVNSDHLRCPGSETRLEETPASFAATLVNSGMGWCNKRTTPSIHPAYEPNTSHRCPVCLHRDAGFGLRKVGPSNRRGSIAAADPIPVLSQVDETVSFSDLLAEPGNYVGRTVMFSGLALEVAAGKGQYRDRGSPTADGSRHVAIGPKGKIGGTLSGGAVGRILDPAVIEKTRR